VAKKVAKPGAAAKFFRLAGICPLYQTLLDRTSGLSDAFDVNISDSLPLPSLYALRKLGRDLSVARRKRRLSTRDMAARLFVSRDTLWRLERGDPGVAMGTLATAAFILGLDARLADLAAPGADEVGLSLEEEKLPKHIRSRK
jgi:hypothetical protein